MANTSGERPGRLDMTAWQPSCSGTTASNWDCQAPELSAIKNGKAALGAGAASRSRRRDRPGERRARYLVRAEDFFSVGVAEKYPLSTLRYPSVELLTGNALTGSRRIRHESFVPFGDSYGKFRGGEGEYGKRNAQARPRSSELSRKQVGTKARPARPAWPALGLSTRSATRLGRRSRRSSRAAMATPTGRRPPGPGLAGTGPGPLHPLRSSWRIRPSCRPPPGLNRSLCHGQAAATRPAQRVGARISSERPSSHRRQDAVVRSQELGAGR